MAGNLTGNYLVRVLRPALHDARKWFPRTSDRMEVRRHALKLRFWPERSPTDSVGKLLDLDWSWISAAHNKKIGELRIQDTIGGHDNIRIIFFDPKKKKASDPLPTLWVLAVFQKKQNAFAVAQIENFKARRLLVLERFYD